MPKARSDAQIEQLKERLNGLMADWGSELSNVFELLQNHQLSAASYVKKAHALEQQLDELTSLRELVSSQDVEISDLRQRAQEQDDQYAELEAKHEQACARISELESRPAAQDGAAMQLNSRQQAEFEAMRTELAARKSVVKNLRADAERGKALEAEIAHNREVIATMRQSIERDAKLMAELKLSASRWERKYLKLAEAGSSEPSHETDFSYSTAFSETVATMFLAESAEVYGEKTIVIDMTEPLREARDERLRKNAKG